MEYRIYSRGHLDKDFINKYFKDADVVHHLAGADVPRTFGEANKDQDEKIKWTKRVKYIRCHKQ